MQFTQRIAGNVMVAALVASKQAEVDEMRANIETFSQELEAQTDSLTGEEGRHGLGSRYTPGCAWRPAAPVWRAQAGMRQSCPIRSSITGIMRIVGLRPSSDA